MRAAVVGHVEWIEFARVEQVPLAGEIVHAQETWGEPGGGGAVAAVQLAKLAGGATFFTALGDDELGHRAFDELTALGLRVEVAWRDEPQRRGFVYIDSAGERTITVIGERLGPERRGRPGLGRDRRRGRRLLHRRGRLSRAARALGPLPGGHRPGARAARRGGRGAGRAGGERHATRASATSPGCSTPSRGWWCAPPARAAARGSVPARREGRYAATELPGPVQDAYGCGDSFAGGLTYGLGAGMDVPEALELAARCGAACLTGRGPYERQLVLGD